MKKLITLSLSIIFMLSLLVLTASASDLIKLDTPTGLKWETTAGKYGSLDVLPGYMTWNKVENAQKYEIALYDQDSNLLASRKISNKNNDITVAFADFFIDSVTQTGKYSFKVKACGDNVTYSDSEWSQTFKCTYVKPEAKLNTPVNLKWDGRILSWDPVEGACGYEVYWYHAANKASTPEQTGSSSFKSSNPGTTMEMLDWVTDKDGFYFAKVRAFSSDIYTVFNSDFSDFSSAILVGEAGGGSGSSGNVGDNDKPDDSTLIKLDTPTGLKWETTIGSYGYHTYKPGYISWKRVENTNKYRVELYKDNVLIFDTNYSLGSGYDTVDMITSDLLFNHIEESGNYYVKLKARGDGQTYTDSDFATSDVFAFTRPEAQLSVPTNIVFEGRLLKWDPVEGANGYEVKWYYSPTKNGTPEFTSSTANWGSNPAAEARLEDWVIENHGEGYYYPTVRALSDNITVISASEYSQIGPVYSTSDVTSGPSAEVDKIVSGITPDSSPEEIQAAVDSVKALDTEALKVAMLTDTSNSSVVQDIQSLERATGIDTFVSAYNNIVDTSKVKCIGAALNAGEGVEEVNLNFREPTEDVEVPGSYKNAVQMDISLAGATADQTTGELAVPVKIIMPVPEGIAVENLIILHYHNSTDEYEILTPHIFTDDGITYASMVLSKFSVFVFAEEENTVIPGDVNGDGKVTRPDLIRLTQYFANWDVEINEGCADTNGDGKITRPDLIRLTQYFANWDVKLGK